MACPYVILVEGADDKHVVRHLLDHHGLDGFDIRDRGGIDNLLETLHVELKASDLRQLGIIVDADESLVSRWQSIRDRLTRSGYENVPKSPDPSGTIVSQPGRPTVGIWLMPNNSVAGILEDFVAALVPDGDQMWSRAEDCVDSVQPLLAASAAKAKIHTWLAWQEEPGVRMGSAINQKYLNPEAERADEFVAWLRLLLAS
ncbi:MAG: hypothetical protein GY953_21400 [bacterium]|nr:hypothetical protein [bacterium]